MTLTTVFLTLVGIYAIFIFYKMKIKKYLFILCILGVVGFVFGINRLETRNKRLTNKRFDSLYSYGKFAYGKVMYFNNNTTKNLSYRASIHYSFESKSEINYEANISTLLPDNFDNEKKKDWKINFEKAEKGDSYLVLYDSLNPNQSILILDMKINKPEDIDKYIRDIEQSRKE